MSAKEPPPQGRSDRTLDYGRVEGARKPRFLPPRLDHAIGIALATALLILAAAFALGLLEGGL